MKTRTTLALTALTLFAAASTASSANDPMPAIDPPAPDGGSRVQIALLLDTSGSMSGLIDQAKTQLWKVVNTFIDARRDGKAPIVEVALYEYGNDSIAAANDWIRQVQPMTRDLDQLSRDLFTLKTGGGEEYCGAVIQRALGDLAWDEKPGTYKAIFIAGNEPFTQGRVEPREACQQAFAKGIVVNTIHCGSRQQGISGSWHDGAALAGGDFMVIDQNKAVAHVAAPQDKQIAELSHQLNSTYIGYGKRRKEAADNQSVADQDADANAGKGADVQRAVCKASSNYSNAHWDLVDATREKKIDLAKVKAEELPEEMRKLNLEERKAYVEKATKKRTAIQTEIKQLSKQREAYVEKEMKKNAADGAQTLDQALVRAARTQATKRGYKFGK